MNIMNLLKKYSFLVIPAAIALVGLIMIIVAFVINSGVKENMGNSLSLARKVQSQLNSTPSSKQADIEKAYQSKHEEDASRIAAMIAQSTMRELVNYKIFPKPKDSSRQIFKDFGSAYRTEIENMVSTLNSGDAPSDKEIETSLAPLSGGRASRSEDMQLVVDALCSKRAEMYSVYLNPKIFKWYELWNDYQYVGFTDAVNDCWYSQVACWVYSDIVDSVAQLNEGSTSVFTSPVKRVIGVSFSSIADLAEQGKSTSASLDIPVYVSKEVAPILGAETWTGRESDEQIDVIHFSISVILAADSVPDFLRTLCSEKTHKFKGWKGTEPEKEYKHNQITVLSSNISPVAQESTENKYYRYGDGVVVQWTGTCEYIFIKNSYESVMPDSIKEKIGKIDR